MYMPRGPTEPLHHLEYAFRAVAGVERLEAKVKYAIRKRLLRKAPAEELYLNAQESGVISEVEFNRLRRVERLRRKAIEVDDFGLIEYRGRDKGSGYERRHRRAS